MKKDIFDNIEQIARKIAEKYSIVNQIKVQVIVVHEDSAYPLISEFFEYNLSELDV